ncbi:hypothetical protein Micbo1qcDRAFT_176942 [Microdochium bolleyi]|uniref:Uncharacterized protein n=1 Tax=Microdochium bolleyi TaxID=196109 RepID=A0A136IXJ9_9PEZI|nr:hypothetical protein Micbo1qcDRAFT_176942 [Microdochium bolleyi]
MADHLFDYQHDCSAGALDPDYLGEWVESNTDITGIGVVIGFDRGSHWRPNLVHCIMDMCDMQLITGLAILLSGFLSVNSPQGSLPAADWYMVVYVVYLAWFAATTHLAGMTTLRSHFASRSRPRIVRVGLMFLLLVALCVAMVPTGYFN